MEKGHQSLPLASPCSVVIPSGVPFVRSAPPLALLTLHCPLDQGKAFSLTLGCNGEPQSWALGEVGGGL